MKKLLATLSVAALAGLASLAPAAAAPLKVGVAAEPYPPFTSPDASGKWSGWEIDFAETVCKKAELECVITPVAWDGIIPALNTGKIDMIISSMSITPDRSKVIDFSDPYYRSNAVIIGPKEQTFGATPEELKGKVLGVQVGTMHMAYAQKHFAPAGVTLREYQTQDEANNDLVAGRIDATQADAIAMQDFLKSPTGEACCDVKGTVPNDPEVMNTAAGIGLRKSDTALKEKLNAAIKGIREDGSYAAFNKKYFDIDIFE
ncbi:transporter substrate-binding domain-containing protein [Paracoccus aminophilus]|uniref:Polar amino acid transport system, substrate-binding protein n=1 Tax=Paracoccus aminophilus JCM 7686 TaxID=1367847 RepID=S5YX26_PARAH|nr:transporter substrate-binding domain-containing protein [Paracoccus aminophilus]AGT09771.1 polar amino acid transport system, substrate-binding protein [Paracoccus aminophilus JCM 7686]